MSAAAILPDERSILAELLGVALQLTGVIESESACLDRSQFQTMQGFGPEKSRLTLRYDALCRAVAALPPALVQAHPEIERLRAAARRLNEAARANAQRLSIHLQANRRVAELVARAAREAVMPSVSYGTRSGYGARNGARATPPLSVTRLL
jgi:hypothetical protein